MTTREHIERDGLLAFVEQCAESQLRFGTAWSLTDEEWQAVADALRGKVLVDEGKMREHIDGQSDDGQCGSCFIKGVGHLCRGWNVMKSSDCRAALLAHFGLEPSEEAK